jgi:hypothetical protein
MVASMKTTNSEAQQWWSNLNNGERRLICAVMRMLKGAKRSHIKEVARAAAKWETGIGCFIKIRLMHQRPPRLKPGNWLRIEGQPQNTLRKAA